MVDPTDRNEPDARLADEMISVVLPAYNEEEAVAEMVEGTRRALEQAGLAPFEILVVDDGSTDATAERAEGAGARLVSHPQNVGYGRSLKDGILAACGDTIVISDADGSYPPEAIPQLVERYREGWDMVIARRSNFRDSVGKSLMRRVLRWLVEYTAGRKVPDVNSGLRVFSKKMIEPRFQTLSDGFSFTTSSTLAYALSSRFVAFVPIVYGPRAGGSKVKLFSDSMRTLQYIVQALVYFNPLKIFVLGAGICIALAFLGFATSALLGFRVGYLLGVGGLLLAVPVFSLGLLADLLKRILDK